jgi:hypothetical protein
MMLHPSIRLPTPTMAESSPKIARELKTRRRLGHFRGGPNFVKNAESFAPLSAHGRCSALSTLATDHGLCRDRARGPRSSFSSHLSRGCIFG